MGVTQQLVPSIEDLSVEKLIKQNSGKSTVESTVEDTKVPVEIILANMSNTDDDKRFAEAQRLLPDVDMFTNLEGYKSLILESHNYGGERFAELYAKERASELTRKEKKELMNIRIQKGLILMKGKDGVKLSREEVKILMDNGIVGIFGNSYSDEIRDEAKGLDNEELKKLYYKYSEDFCNLNDSDDNYYRYREYLNILNGMINW